MSTRGYILSDPECGSCEGPGSQVHHLVRLGNPWRGGDEIANVVCLCHGCHMDFHHSAARWREVGHKIGDYLVEFRPDAVRYIVTQAGLGYAERYYGIEPEEARRIIVTFDRGRLSRC